MRWDRHYRVGDGHTLALVGGRNLELRRNRVADGFRIEEVLLAAAFPLDGMSLSLLAAALGRPAAAIDRRNPQAFVDSLAGAALPQASVLKELATMHNGAVEATTMRASVPDWRAAATFVTFAAQSAAALRALRIAAGLERQPHLDFDAWLAEAHRRAPAPVARAA